jgi:hypothetical protein
MAVKWTIASGLSFLSILGVIQLSYSQCINTGSSTLISVCAGSLPYVWNNNSYNAPGNYMVTLANARGCDSVVNLSLQVHSASSSSSQNTCPQNFPLVWQGKTLTETGAYMDTVINNLGCDSIIVLNLTATDTWDGTASNNWEDVNNWSCRVLPDATTDVVINSGTVILNSNQTIRSLTVAPGATFTVAQGFDLNITSATLPAAPIYLTKYIGRLDNDSAYYGYIQKDYYYDSLKRLQSVVTNIYQFPGGLGEPRPDFGYPDSLIYYYNPGDSLPYKAAHFNGGYYDPSEYYTYDNQTRISRVVYSRAEGVPLRYDYTYPGNEIVSTDTFGLSYHLGYDGRNVTYGTWIDATVGFVTQQNNLLDPFSFVPVNRHIPYGEGFVTPAESYFNKNAVAESTGIYYHVVYEYDGIINSVPARAKLTKTENGQVSHWQQYYYYKH